MGGERKLYMEATRVHDNVFPFFASEDGRTPAPKREADVVRWEIDPSQPSESWLSDPLVILDMPSEVPRIDERFNTKKYTVIFLDVFMPHDQHDGTENLFHGLNALAMLNAETGEKQYFYLRHDTTVQETTFIPRSANAPEGDGWVLVKIEQRVTAHCELVIIDTRDFEKPIGTAQPPFRIKSQIHGNWVDGQTLGSMRKRLVAMSEPVKISGKGALEPF